MNRSAPVSNSAALLTTIFCCLALLLFPGCGEPEPGGPGRTAGSRAGLTSSGELPPPRIVFSSLVHDFGQIDESESVSHRFTFHNRGKSLLFIRNIKPS